MKRFLIVFIFLLMCVSYVSAGGTATLSWNLITNSTQIGIKVFMSTSPDVEMSEENLIANLPIDTIVHVVAELGDGEYFFVVASYDANGDLLGPSNECSKIIGSPPSGLQCG